jgi:hypothetical protein
VTSRCHDPEDFKEDQQTKKLKFRSDWDRVRRSGIARNVHAADNRWMDFLTGARVHIAAKLALTCEC